MKNLQNVQKCRDNISAGSKKIAILVLTCVALFTFTSCFEDLDDNAIATSDINDFVWKAMNVYYAYKDNISDLSNDRFNSNEDYRNYLNDFQTPEDLFESLIYLPNTVDEFSTIVPNYFDLEQLLEGTTLNNGMVFGLVKLPNAANDVIGYIRYVLPNTDAEEKGLTRGLIFNVVDGEVLTENNFEILLRPTTYTIGFADYNNNGTPGITSDDIIVTNNQSVTLTKTAYTENPILTHNILNVSGSSIGYLMYNGFRSNDNNLNELNAVFGEFQSEGISDLVIDLRYNGGGSVNTAIWLASMITGQFTDDVFFKEKWNTDIQTALEQSNPESLNNPFVDEMIKRNSNGDVTYQQSINSLNLNKVYVITSRSTASASELVINGLAPYIDVVQIGLTTRGKPQASITLYDSQDYTRNNVNPNHTYALQPLIYESENANGFSEYYNGISPSSDFTTGEDYDNLGQLGNVEERLLAIAIADITGLGRPAFSVDDSVKEIADQNFDHPLLNEMIDDNALKFKVSN
jgi:C-terminal processing protease CtpA/Prc